MNAAKLNEFCRGDGEGAINLWKNTGIIGWILMDNEYDKTLDASNIVAETVER